MSTKLNFTKRTIEAINPPRGKRVVLHDAKTPGLCVEVTPTGAKSFYRYGRINGRPRRLRLGAFPAMSVEQAQNRAREIGGDIAKGENPHRERMAVRDEMTLGELFTLYLETYAKIKKRTWAEDQRQYDHRLKTWGHRRLGDISATDVARLHAKTGEKAPYAANRLVALIRKLFNHAAVLGWKGTNPAKGIAKFPEYERDRFLDGPELKRFFTALKDEPNETIRDCIVTALLTGARRANVQSMRWADVNLDRGIWQIPGQVSKSKRAMVTFLPEQVVDRLRARRKADPDSEYVFPGDGMTGHLVEVKNAWKRITKAAGLTDAKFHDLRRSLASWMTLGGANVQVVGAALGHRTLSTTLRYARLQQDTVRQAVNVAADSMLKHEGKALPAPLEPVAVEVWP